jgi:hypothetical protein
VREIKFRAKFIMGINEGEWDYFNLSDLMECPSEDFESWYDIETLGQYTGSKDRNGKEIYEGDIVVKTFWDRPYSQRARSRQLRCRVIWTGIKNGSPGFDIKHLEEWGQLGGYDGGPLSGVEVIGNICENKDLFE